MHTASARMPSARQAATSSEAKIPSATITRAPVTSACVVPVRVDVFDVRLNERGKVEFMFPAHHNLGMLVMKGDVTLNGAKATVHDFAVFKNVGERVIVEAESEAQLLVLSGEPIDEQANDTYDETHVAA